MSLLQSIGEIFDVNLSHSLERFLVEDAGIFVPGTLAVRSELDVVLLVESPHTDEVAPHDASDRYPLKGSAGRHVRDKLSEWAPLTLGDPERSIGQLVHQGCDAVLKLGIMNVSQLPLQDGAYINQGGECQGDEVRRNERWPDYIRCMEHIKCEPYVRHYDGFRDRNGNGTGLLQREINDLQDAISKDLKERLDYLTGCNKNVTLVPCGDVASAFYLKACVTCLPHPARSGWRNLDGQNACLRDVLERLWPT